MVPKVWGKVHPSTDQTLEQAVETLLRAWVSGRLKIVSDKAGPRSLRLRT